MHPDHIPDRLLGGGSKFIVEKAPPQFAPYGSHGSFSTAWDVIGAGSLALPNRLARSVWGSNCCSQSRVRPRGGGHRVRALFLPLSICLSTRGKLFARRWGGGRCRKSCVPVYYNFIPDQRPRVGSWVEEQVKLAKELAPIPVECHRRREFCALFVQQIPVARSGSVNIRNY